MFSNRNRKLHTTSYSSSIRTQDYCCQSPNTCVKFNRTQADLELLKQFGISQTDMSCKVCKNVNLIN